MIQEVVEDRIGAQLGFTGALLMFFVFQWVVIVLALLLSFGQRDNTGHQPRGVAASYLTLSLGYCLTYKTNELRHLNVKH